MKKRTIIYVSALLVLGAFTFYTGDRYGNPNETMIAGTIPPTGYVDETIWTSDADCLSATPLCTDVGGRLWICQ